MKESDYKRYVIILIAISAAVRSLLAVFINLGGEEAYYWTFAQFPELGSFDQPPMIGWFIQLFTNNLALPGEFFLRLSSIITGSANIWIIYIIGRRVKGESAGFYSALLYSLSFYLSLVAGLFILPEGPQTFFYLLSLYFLLEGAIPRDKSCAESRILCRMAFVLAGLFIGFATLSKFSSVLLWLGLALYAIIFDRNLLKRAEVYFAAFVTLLSMFPVILWNYQNDFIGFEYLAGTLRLSGGVNIETFFKGIIIPLLINNPVNLYIIFRAVKKHRTLNYIRKDHMQLLLSLSLPVIIVSVVFSLVSESFIYAASLGFTPLIIVGGSWLSSVIKNEKPLLGFRPLRISLYTFILVILTGVIHHYAGPAGHIVAIEKEGYLLGSGDFTLDRYGMKRLSGEFKKIRDLDIAAGRVSQHSYIIEFDYKTAALRDYYLASSCNTVVKTWGPLSKVRKYKWITAKHGGLKKGESVYYIQSSRSNFDGVGFGLENFENVQVAKVIYLKRFGFPVVRYTVYRFINLKNIPPC